MSMFKATVTTLNHGVQELPTFDAQNKDEAVDKALQKTKQLYGFGIIQTIEKIKS